MEESSKKLMKDIGERNFLSQISHLVDINALDFNDDASAFELPSGDLLVLNVDMLIYKKDVLPGMDFKQVGKKAVTMAVSDIIAKGVKPLGCLVSVGFPAETEVKKAKDILFGVKEKCINYNTLFLGGDLNESSDIIVDVVAFGLSRGKKIIPRKGAEKGDLIFSSGSFGFTSLGFKILLEDFSVPDEIEKLALLSVYEPKAVLDFLQLLEKLPIKICMDSSDGLLVTLSELSKINNLGIDIINVPLDNAISDFTAISGLNPLDLAFNGGEEFELIFAISPDKKSELLKVAEKLDLSLHHIGIFNDKHDEIVIIDSMYKKYDLPQDGFEHFKGDN